MKIIIFLITICLFTFELAAQYKDNFQYLSPLPRSEYVSPQTTLIFRLNGHRHAAKMLDRMQVTVNGELSGEHQGRLFLASDKQTIIFKPARHFAAEETVSVEISLNNAPDSRDLDYYFTTSQVRDISPSIRDTEQEINQAAFEKEPARTCGDARLINGVFVPGDFPVINIDSLGVTAPGKIFLSGWHGLPYIMIVNNKGAPYFYQRMPGYSWDLTLQPTGTLTRYDIATHLFIEMNGNYEILDTFNKRGLSAHRYDTADRGYESVR